MDHKENVRSVLKTDVPEKTRPFLLLLYLSANALFIYKYGARTPLGSYLPTLLYAALLPAGAWVYLKYVAPRIDNMRSKPFACVYAGAVVLFAAVAVALLFNIDANATNVDRWSALHNMIGNLFDGKLPYLAKTHINSNDGGPSPLPIMMLIAIPFYFLGDVGYIQVFTFVAMAAIVFFSDEAMSGKLFFLLVFLLSPAFWYEVATRSDLMSNMMIMGMGLLLMEKVSNGDPLNRPVMTGFIAGLIFSTRGIFIVPFTVFFFAKCALALKKFEITKNILFCASIAATFALTILPFALWDMDSFIANSPLTPQAGKTPLFVVIAILALAAFLSFKARTDGDAFKWTAFSMFALMGITLTLDASAVGWDTAIFSHYFDITYYSTMIPFIALGLFYGSRKSIGGGDHAAS